MPLHHAGLMLAVMSHLWVTESSHPTSDGVVIYQRCACSAHRILLADVESSARLKVAVVGSNCRPPSTSTPPSHAPWVASLRRGVPRRCPTSVDGGRTNPHGCRNWALR